MRNIGLKHLALASLSGALLVLSFPRFDCDFAAWICLVPLLLALDDKHRPSPYIICLLTGVIFFSVGVWGWSIPGFNTLDFSLLTLYLSQYVALWGVGYHWTRRKTRLPSVVVAPALWILCEYGRAHASFLSLPWLLLGHSQYLHPPLIQIAAFSGVYGLSFIIVLSNVAVAEMLSFLVSRYRLRDALHARSWSSSLLPMAVAGCLILLTVWYGNAELSSEALIEENAIEIGIVQGNVPPMRRWELGFRQEILDRYSRLTQDVARLHPALIVWPETSVPGDVIHDSELGRRVSEIASKAGAYLLVGSSHHAKFLDPGLQNKHFNSMVLFGPDGTILGEYRKMKLVPFGEYEPLKGFIQWPESIAPIMGNTLPGDTYTLFSVGEVAFGAVICWESIFPEHYREFINRGARFMVSASNESWFGETAAPHQLLAITVFRAVENKIAIVKVANTGISAVIDPFGRITNRLADSSGKELFTEGVMLVRVPIPRGPVLTFYAQYGDCFILLLTVGILVVACALILRSRISLQPFKKPCAEKSAHRGSETERKSVDLI